MILYPGEQGFSTDPIDWSMIPGYPFQDGGYLYLTNIRLVFEAVGHGAPNRTLVNLDLRHIVNVSVGPGPNRRLVLRVETTTGWAFLVATPNAANCAHAIVRARDAALAAAPPQGRTEAAKPLVFLHCKHCGTLNPAGRARCTSCGAGL